MRIRKHAKVSPLTYAASSVNTAAAHFCQLNQSPWDVITFPKEEEEEDAFSLSTLLLPPQPSPPPPPLNFLFDGFESYPQNGSFNGSNDASQSAESAILPPPSPPPERDYFAYPVDAAEEIAAEQVEPPEILCGKTDGKTWQCKREAKVGNAFCEHHIEQLKHYSNLAHPMRAAVTKKFEKQIPVEAAAANRSRRPRPKKSSASSSNPYDLYYYTGFGPLWGKKRGPGRTSCSNNVVVTNAVSDEPADRGDGTTSSASEMDDGEFDYVEDEYEDDEDDSDNGKKKKARKPIKARSLKSLM